MFIKKLTDNIKYKKWVLDGFLYIRKIENLETPKKKEEFIYNNINLIAKNEKNNNNILLCFNNKDDIIGYLWYIKQTICPVGVLCYGEEKEYMWIHSIFVDPSMRKQGVGTYLYKELEKICKEEKIEKIYSDVYFTNKKSEIFHDKLNFKKEMYIYSKTV